MCPVTREFIEILVCGTPAGGERAVCFPSPLQDVSVFRVGRRPQRLWWAVSGQKQPEGEPAPALPSGRSSGVMLLQGTEGRNRRWGEPS